LGSSWFSCRELRGFGFVPKRPMAAEEDQDPVPFSEALCRLSDLGRPIHGESEVGREPVEGEKQGMVYRQLDCSDRNILPLKGIENFVHIQRLDVSQNAIVDVAPLKSLPFVLTLNLSRNKIPHLKPFITPDGEPPVLIHLAILDVSDNALTALPALLLPALQAASFARNQIVSLADWPGHEKLESLDLSSNSITNLTGMANMPALKKLDVSMNQIGDLGGLAEGLNLAMLEDFRLRANALKLLEAPWADLATLKTLDLAGNQLATPAPLEMLRKLPLLRNLSVAGNYFIDGPPTAPTPNPRETVSSADTPVPPPKKKGKEKEKAKTPEPEPDATPKDAQALAGIVAVADPRAEVLICHWRLENLDGQPVLPEERERARLLNIQRIQTERDRKKAEDEAAAAAAEDG